jgi:hypothetical protein
MTPGAPSPIGRHELDPLPLGLVAAGGTELMAGMRVAGRGAPGETAAVHVAQAAALAASARRASWRVPVISSLVAMRLLGLIALVAGRGGSGGVAIRRAAPLALWLVALLQLRHEAARAQAWNAPSPRR